MTDRTPLLPTASMTLAQRKRCGKRFLAETQKALKAVIKGTGWRHKQAWLYHAVGDWYQTAMITGGTTPDGMAVTLKATYGIKPMSADPLYWRWMGLHANLDKPVSHRSNAAFCARELPMDVQQWEEGLTDPETAAEQVFDGVQQMAGVALATAARQPFSEIVATHPKGKDYRALRWVSLAAEGDPETALAEMAEHYLDGPSDMRADAQVEALMDAYRRMVAGTDSPHAVVSSFDIRGTPIIHRRQS